MSSRFSLSILLISSFDIFGSFFIRFIKYSLSFDVAHTAPFKVGIPVPLFLLTTLPLDSLILNKSISFDANLLKFLSIIPTTLFSSLSS